MCRFTLSFKQDAETIIKQAKQQMEKVGGNFDGDSSGGQFQVKTPIGSIEGTYTIVQQEITFDIPKKPFLLSCSQIEKELTKLLQ